MALRMTPRARPFSGGGFGETVTLEHTVTACAPSGPPYNLAGYKAMPERSVEVLDSVLPKMPNHTSCGW
jgi:hypothetical protein